ncbi:MAG TPA: metallophosphoesterase [Gemmatimonadaceae bacterium]|nr:metallophosphoesterase [Gemmatimonadaceae bacterium]
MDQNGTVRLAAMGDIHCGKGSAGSLQPIFAQAAASADVLLVCGDLTDFGQPDEARMLAKELAAGVGRMPVVMVLGNHDYESGKHEDVCAILGEAGAAVLDGGSVELHGVGFAGVKGFCGGFGRGALGPWGEDIIKRFVHEAVDEALKLETALARLRSPRKIALLHYAPIRETVVGEPPEIFPYLGSSRLAEPLTRYPVSAVFHGHAHNGSLDGRTAGDVPVYNVAMPLLRKLYPDRAPFRVVSIPPMSDAETDMTVDYPAVGR